MSTPITTRSMQRWAEKGPAPGEPNPMPLIDALVDAGVVDLADYGLEKKDDGTWTKKDA